MKQIVIPMFNLVLNINPIAFHIFGVPVYWYAIFIVGSMILSLFMYYKKNGTFGIHYDDIIDLSLILIPVSFVCARIYYVLFNLKNYTSFSQMINIKDGGLAIYGGILGGAITAYIFCKKRKISFLDLADYVIPYLALRAKYWKMGKLYKWRSLWKCYKLTMENGNLRKFGTSLCTSNISLRIYCRFLNILNLN